MARRFGITSPLPPYLPLALGAADLSLLEHTSAFTVFPDDGIHIEPHDIRRVTSYDGAVLEEPRPNVKDVVQPDVARTMTAMLEEVVQFGTGVRAKELGRVSAGKTGTTNDFTDAWYIGFTPHITAGVWVGNDDKRISLGKKETGARAALPIWLEFMQQAVAGVPGAGFSERSAAREGSGRTSGEGGYSGYGAARGCRRAGADADAGFAAGKDARRATVSGDASRRECCGEAVRENFGTQAELALAFLAATNKSQNSESLTRRIGSGVRAPIVAGRVRLIAGTRRNRMWGFPRRGNPANRLHSSGRNHPAPPKGSGPAGMRARDRCAPFFSGRRSADCRFEPRGRIRG